MPPDVDGHLRDAAPGIRNDSETLANESMEVTPMCDLGPLFTTLGVAAALITASVASIAVAAALNGGFFSAPGAPIPMIAAAATAAAAAVLIVTAQQKAFEYFACVGSPAGCQTDLNNLTEALEALAGTLAVQAIAAGVVAASAWIPWAAQPAMWAIAAALLTQLAMIPTAILYANDFLDCVEATGVRKFPNPLIVAAGISLLLGLTLIRASTRRSAAVPK